MRRAIKAAAGLLAMTAAAVLLIEFVKLVGAALLLIHDITGIPL